MKKIILASLFSVTLVTTAYASEELVDRSPLDRTTTYAFIKLYPQHAVGSGEGYEELADGRFAKTTGRVLVTGQKVYTDMTGKPIDGNFHKLRTNDGGQTFRVEGKGDAIPARKAS